jgi:hypothetical protein
MSFSERAKALQSNKNRKQSRFSLGSLIQNAKTIKESNKKKFDSMISEHQIPTNAPTYKACEKSFLAGGIPRALSKAPEDIKKQVWKVVSKKRFVAFSKAEKEAKKGIKKNRKKYMKLFDKLPPQEWLMIPEWMIIRDTDWVNLDNIKKGGTYSLPPILTGTKKGFWDMLISYTRNEPGTEEFGSIIKSKYGISDRNNSSNNYCDYIPCYQALISMVKFYRVGAKFCKGDPYAALFRANMRHHHPVHNILADGIYFENDFSLVRGHRNQYSGIEVNGIFYRLPAEQIVDTFMRLRNKKDSTYTFLMLIRIQAIANISADVAFDIWRNIKDCFRTNAESENYAKVLNQPINSDAFEKLTSKFDLLTINYNKEKDNEGGFKLPPEFGGSGWSFDQFEQLQPTYSEEEDEGSGDDAEFEEFDIAKAMSGLSDPETDVYDDVSSGDESYNEEVEIEDDFFLQLNTGIDSMLSGITASIDILEDEENDEALKQIYGDISKSDPNYTRTAPYALQHGQSAVEILEDERTFSRKIHFSEDRIVFIEELQKGYR